jgi:hypothetical protein
MERRDREKKEGNKKEGTIKVIVKNNGVPIYGSLVKCFQIAEGLRIGKWKTGREGKESEISEKERGIQYRLL